MSSDTSIEDDIRNFFKELPDNRLRFNPNVFWEYVICLVVFIGPPLVAIWRGQIQDITAALMVAFLMSVGVLLMVSLSMYNPKKGE